MLSSAGHRIIVRYVNAVFNQLHDLLDASAMVDPELD